VKFVWKEGAHTRFRVPFLASGALGRCGHVKVLGIYYGWLDNIAGGADGWASQWGLSLWGLISFVYQSTLGGKLKATKPGMTVHWLRVQLRSAVRPARPW
jgi:hypothetical protein